VTTQKSAIKILFSLMAEGKMSSQMNPLAKGDLKAMLAEFRSVEIQARDGGLLAKGSARDEWAEDDHGSRDSRARIVATIPAQQLSPGGGDELIF
jgi:hypothetical protein